MCYEGLFIALACLKACSSVSGFNPCFKTQKLSHLSWPRYLGDLLWSREWNSFSGANCGYSWCTNHTLQYGASIGYVVVLYLERLGRPCGWLEDTLSAAPYRRLRCSGIVPDCVCRIKGFKIDSNRFKNTYDQYMKTTYHFGTTYHLCKIHQ